MRRPAHANPDMVLAAVVFQSGSRKALFEAMGADPAKIAKVVSEHPSLAPTERTHVRSKVKKGLEVMQDRVVPNLDFMQLEIGSRRIRLRTIS